MKETGENSIYCLSLRDLSKNVEEEALLKYVNEKDEWYKKLNMYCKLI